MSDTFNSLLLRQEGIYRELKRLRAEKDEASHELLLGAMGHLQFVPPSNAKVRELAGRIAALETEYDQLKHSIKAVLNAEHEMLNRQLANAREGVAA